MTNTTAPKRDSFPPLAFNIIDRNGRRFGQSRDRDRALGLAGRIGGTVTTEVFGEMVTLTP